jgi:hypothetical protein
MADLVAHKRLRLTRCPKNPDDGRVLTNCTKFPYLLVTEDVLEILAPKPFRHSNLFD